MHAGVASPAVVGRLRSFAQGSAQDVDDLSTKDVVGLELREYLDELVVAALVELSNDVGPDVGLGRQNPEQLMPNRLRQLRESFDGLVTRHGSVRQQTSRGQPFDIIHHQDGPHSVVCLLRAGDDLVPAHAAARRENIHWSGDLRTRDSFAPPSADGIVQAATKRSCGRDPSASLPDTIGQRTIRRNDGERPRGLIFGHDLRDLVIGRVASPP